MTRSRARATDEPAVSRDLVTRVWKQSTPLRRDADLDPLLERIGDARVVLLGEASHGTHEFYTWRAALSRRLLEEQGFQFLAVEGDWPDCYRVNRYVKGYTNAGETAREVLHAFERWPTWMWANEEIVDLAEWLHDFNVGWPEGHRVGFYGLDVYSLQESLSQIMGYLRRTDGQALEAARRALWCLEPFGEDSHQYARATALVPRSCETEVVQLLRTVRAQARSWPEDGADTTFSVLQNASVLQEAEAYYRTAIRNDVESWNIRARHMADTLDQLLAYHGPDSRAIVWEHNTHIGDARYTDLAEGGMFNLGQLARERLGEQSVVLVGFSTWRGSVIAGSGWDMPMEEMTVPEGRPGSWEDVLHRAGASDRLLLLAEGMLEPEGLAWRGQRAIGVVYHPEWDHYGNYLPTILPRRYDALLHIDQTHAVRPLHMPARVERDWPETWPVGV
jgi:erythromycin esterase-like protein